MEDDDEPFEVKFPRLVAELESQFAESDKLTADIRRNFQRFWGRANHVLQPAH